MLGHKTSSLTSYDTSHYVSLASLDAVFVYMLAMPI